MSAYTLKTNNHPRPLFSLSEVKAKGFDRETFSYITEDEMYDARLFEYRGAWYDAHEFTLAGNDIAAMGFNGVQGESYFSAVVVRYFDREGHYMDDEIVVGYLYW